MEYKKVKLKEVCTVNQGLQIPISKRFREKAINRYLYITIQFLKGNAEEYYIENPKESVICTKEDILVVRTGSTGIVLTNVEGCFHNNFFKVVPNKKIYRKYLYYTLSNNYMYKKMLNVASGTTIPDLKHSSFYDLEIPLPDLEAQHKIVNILENIDRKIELNNQINNNLHEFCKNLYKEWFIKYNYPNKDDKMKESILGNIPYTWNVCKVQEITKIKRGASPRPIQDYICNEGINWLKISDVTGITEPYIYNIKEKIKEEGKSKSYYIEKGTLVVSNSATPGIPKFIEVDTCVHDGWLVLSEYEDYYKYFIYFLMLNFRDKLVNMANGSVFQNLKTEILKEFEFVNPTDSVLIEFSKIINPLMEKIKKYVKENLVLEQLRDTLLPKLMNGEIDLENIEI